MATFDCKRNPETIETNKPAEVGHIEVFYARMWSTTVGGYAPSCSQK